MPSRNSSRELAFETIFLDDRSSIWTVVDSCKHSSHKFELCPGDEVNLCLFNCDRCPRHTTKLSSFWRLSRCLVCSSSVDMIAVSSENSRIQMMSRNGSQRSGIMCLLPRFTARVTCRSGLDRMVSRVVVADHRYVVHMRDMVSRCEPEY
jgi:hypothetical protein